jgi:hypothetical protein
MARLVSMRCIHGSGEAAAIMPTELYQLLVGRRSCSPDRFEHFLAGTWHRRSWHEAVNQRVRVDS